MSGKLHPWEFLCNYFFFFCGITFMRIFFFAPGVTGYSDELRVRVGLGGAPKGMATTPRALQEHVSVVVLSAGTNLRCRFCLFTYSALVFLLLVKFHFL